ncbi:Acyl-CoA thioesterase [Penicillium sp. DV-2018c]|nr:Acyl-CoA thioesterase [Penicillium sp. DV-2018c]
MASHRPLTVIKEDEPTSPRSPRAFVELMALEQLEDTTLSHPDTPEPEKVQRFRSLAKPYNPGHGPRSFGGHVYAQSAYAASKTVSPGFVIHDMTGSFIRGGKPHTPYVYTVRHIRDGYMYSTRSVDARQAGKICFSCICSFKRDEKQRLFNHQPSSAQERFASVLNAKRPEDQPVSPSVDAEWWIENIREGNISEHIFPGLDVRKTDMMDYNAAPEVKSQPERYRQLTQYRLLGSPDADPDATVEEIREREERGNMIICMLNSLLLIPRALGISHWSDMASLTLMVVVHAHAEALRMIDWERVGGGEIGVEGGFAYEVEGWTPRAAENRAVHESYLWGPDGTLLGTSLQDSMLRLERVKL